MASELAFTIKLTDQMGAPARQASESVGKLTQSLTKAKAALAVYQAQLGRAKQLGDIAGYKKYSALVDQGRRSVFGLTQQVEGLSARSEGLSGMLGSAAGPLGMVATGALAAGTAVAGLTFEAIKFAAEMTTSRTRTIAMFEALGEGPGAGKKTLDFLDDLAKKLPQTRDELVPWAKELNAIGITDLGELKGQLRAVATAQATVGEEGAEHYLNLTRRIREAVDTHTGLKIADKQLALLTKTGVRVTDVAAEMGVGARQLRDQLKAGTVNAAQFGAALETALIKKGQPALNAMRLDLPTTLAKGREEFGKLFDSIDFAPLTAGLRDFFTLFDQSEPAGRSLKDTITGALNAIVKWLGHAATETTIFFLEAEVLWLRAELFTKPYIKAWHNISDAIDLALHPLKTFVDYSERAIGFLPKLIGKNIDKLLPNVGALGAAKPEGAEGPPMATAPGHARGGLVTRAAHGEAFASVAQGEYILPRTQVAQLRAGFGGGFGMHAGGGIGGRYVANDNWAARQGMGIHMGMGAGAGQRGTHIERVELHITAPHGVTDATEVSANGLARALERYQLAVGR